MTRPYHHGDLRAALLRSAVEVVAERGVAATSLREVARRAGASHTAAAYHFGDKAGLLTAVAAEGYRLLGDALAAARRERGSFLEVGVAYVGFAVEHPAHFDVMFQPRLYDPAHPEVAAARARTAAILYGTDGTDDPDDPDDPDEPTGTEPADASAGGAVDRERLAAGVAAWSMVHGLATLWRNGAVPGALGEDPEEVARLVAVHLRTARR